jgi:hypothetical protein
VTGLLRQCLVLARVVQLRVALLVIASWLALASETAAQDSQPVVIPFDFQSEFDNGRYGQMVGDMIWKKLEGRGRFIIPESMLDVRDWQQRRGIIPAPDTPLADMKQYVVDDFGADVGIWGKVERAGGVEYDVYDLTIFVADFSGQEPKMLFQTKARTKTVSEIPHVYVKQALDALYGDSAEAADAVDPDVEKRWKQERNLVAGDFEKGVANGPAGWDPMPPYVTRIPLTSDGRSANHVIRFQFPEAVAASSGVLYYSDYFPVEAGATYRFQCRWRTTGSAAKVFIKCYDEMATAYLERKNLTSAAERREVYRSQQNLKGPAKTWNVQTEDFTPKHTQFSPKWGRVMLYAYWPEGTVDWDDVVVKQIKLAPKQTSAATRRPSLETKVTSDELEAANRK